MISVIPNGVDTNRFSSLGRATVRDAESAPLVVVVGRFHIAKGQDIALEAFARLGNHDARLRFVGDGETRIAVQRRAAELDLGDRVEFVGTAPALEHLLAADVVLVPSRWEGLSLLVLEAMAAGCAIVATPAAGQEALGETGVVLPDAVNLDAMAAAVDALLVDRARQAELGRRARARVIDHYSMEISERAHLLAWGMLATS